MTQVSVIICTRNRPALFAMALASVLAQRDASFEIIVAMDGSDPSLDAAYDAVFAAAGASLRVIRLDATPRGHGHSYAANRAIALAGGAYLAFLDDDDCWIDPLYLSRACASFAAFNGTVDAYFANQVAYRGDDLVGGDVVTGIWLERRADVIAARAPADSFGAHPVTPQVLMPWPGHCHLNTLLVRRAFYAAIGGLDDDIRYEEDRDLYLRIVDRAEAMLYCPCVVARHNVPDPRLTSNLSTSSGPRERLLSQMRVFDKSILLARRTPVRQHALAQKAFVQRRIAALCAAEGRDDLAAVFARESLGPRFSLKWVGYCAWLSLRALLRRK